MFFGTEGLYVCIFRLLLAFCATKIDFKYYHIILSDFRNLMRQLPLSVQLRLSYLKHIVGVYLAHVYRGPSRGPCIGVIYTHPSRVGGIHALFSPTIIIRKDNSSGSCSKQTKTAQSMFHTLNSFFISGCKELEKEEK